MSLEGSKKLEKVLAEIGAKLGHGQVKVGFMEGAKYPDGTPVPAVAFWNEFGDSTRPPRPFFRQMIAKESSTWGPKLAKLIKGAKFDGDQALALMGEDIGGALVQSINEFMSPELAESTKAAKGFDKPLIDTGHMLRSMHYQVEGESKVPIEVEG